MKILIAVSSLCFKKTQTWAGTPVTLRMEIPVGQDGWVADTFFRRTNLKIEKIKNLKLLFMTSPSNQTKEHQGNTQITDTLTSVAFSQVPSGISWQLFVFLFCSKFSFKIVVSSTWPWVSTKSRQHQSDKHQNPTVREAKCLCNS